MYHRQDTRRFRKNFAGSWKKNGRKLSRRRIGSHHCRPKDDTDSLEIAERHAEKEKDETKFVQEELVEVGSEERSKPLIKVALGESERQTPSWSSEELQMLSREMS